MEEGLLGVAGRLAWLSLPARIEVLGEPIGNAAALTVQNFSSWRCESCKQLLTDYGGKV